MGALKEFIPNTEIHVSQTCSQGSCCRDPGSDEERTLIDIDLVRNMSVSITLPLLSSFKTADCLLFDKPSLPFECRIIGLSDGLTVPFGLTAGLSSLGSSRLVVVAGMAEVSE
jgi:hypothetical protein